MIKKLILKTNRGRTTGLRMARAVFLMLVFPVLAGGLTGCAQINAAAIQLGLAKSPYYHLGDTTWDHGGIEEYYFNQIPSEENEIYRELYERLKNGEDEATLYAHVPTEQFWDAYYAVLADHPEFFWVGSNIEVSEAALTGEVVSYRISVTVPAEEREAMRLSLENAADQCIGGIPADATDYQKIKYVYEYLINTTDYVPGSESDQNVQSALLYHQSVCAGYSRAFQYILHRMGLFCTYITGRTSEGGDHAWNVVRIDGAYYNVDVTWGDPVFTGDSQGIARSSMNYNYLCVPDAELAGTHTADISVPLPACTDESYNYYRLNGMYYEVFDYDRIHQALMDSVYAQSSSISMKFAWREDYDTAVYELFSNGLISDAARYLMDVNGTSTWNYSYHTEDAFLLITIYW